MSTYPTASPPGQPQFRGLYGLVVEELGKMLVIGRLGGDSPLDLPKIREYFGVSRTVLREALRALQNKGLLHSRPSIGTRVRPITEWNLFDPDVLRWARTTQSGALREDQAAFLAAIQTLRDLEPGLKNNLYFEALLRNLETRPELAKVAPPLHEHAWPVPESDDPLAKPQDCDCGMTHVEALKLGLVRTGE